MGEATDSVSAGLALNRRGYVQVEASYNVDPHYNDLYRDHYSGICPLTPLAFQQAPGLRRGWSVTQSADYKASEYFNDWARPQGWMEIVGVDLVRNATNVGGLALWRSAGALELSPEAMDLLRRVTPHLRRAFSIRTALDQAACAEETMKRAVQAAGFALVLLAADGKVAFANERAETLLRRQSGLYGAHGRIDLSGVSPAALAGGATFNISRGAGESPLAVHILPLRKGQADRIGVGSPIAAMFILDPSADFEARAAEFGRRFNLTTAETRLLARVARGEGLLATARGLGVTEHTARTHLNRIFSKTDTTRQADLVRQFLQTTLPI
ncbi:MULTISPECIES: helix-turn-helix transcriptional regulator [unclassified Sphingomonas]|uniref:helix-turn-helix transcriptional regulator n=5 Tax=Pseudomonadota TaxID=1224 RepID=UPI0010F7047D|nr:MULTISPECIES: helix-turn-helix transcriptional regulator [unclassified Sphingomonas]